MIYLFSVIIRRRKRHSGWAGMAGMVFGFILAAALATVAPSVTQAQTMLDLRNVELRSFVQIVAEQTGRNFVLDPAVSGTVTVIAPTAVSPQTVYEVFLNVLELNRLTIVEGAGVDRIVPTDRAASLSTSQQAAMRAGAYETRVLQVQSGDLDEIVETLLPLIASDAVLTPIYSAGLLVLSDRRENIERIANLVRRLDRTQTGAVDAISLRHANAEALLGVINSLGIVPNGANVSADARANTIIASGPPEFRQRIRQVVAQLDTPQRRSVSTVVRLNYADAAELAEVLRQSIAAPQAGADGLVPGNEITVVAEPQSNAILLTAPGDRIEALAQSVRALDTRPAQVLIEAVIFEVSAENFSDLSVQFGGILDNAFGGGTSFDLDGRASLVTLINSAFANPGAGGGIGVRSSDRNFAGLLTALARERSTRLLSTPAVLTLNNQEAEIVVAQNVPFVTGSFATVGDSAVPDRPFQTIERQDVGLTLRVKPQITSDNMVRMAITQEVSNLTGSAAAAGGEITASRRLSTNALVGDNRVIMLGGLIEESSRTSSDRVPGLSNIPVLGNLFRGRNLQDGQRVLLVMLRPRVIRSTDQATQLTREIASQTEALSREINPRNTALFPQQRRTGFPFDGVDLNQPFSSTYVDKAVRDRLFPALPPRLVIDGGQ